MSVYKKLQDVRVELQKTPLKKVVRTNTLVLNISS